MLTSLSCKWHTVALCFSNLNKEHKKQEKTKSYLLKEATFTPKARGHDYNFKPLPSKFDLVEECFSDLRSSQVLCLYIIYTWKNRESFLADPKWKQLLKRGEGRSIKYSLERDSTGGLV